MKKILFFPLFLFVQIAFAQTTNRPQIDSQVSNEISISQIQLTDQYTIVSMSYSMRQGRQTQQAVISISPLSFLVDKRNNKIYRYVKVNGISEYPAQTKVQSGQTYNFAVYYELLDPGAEYLDYIETENILTADLENWNFSGIRINNPASAKRNIPNLPSPRVNEPSSISFNGRILDAITKQPLVAKIAFQFISNGKQQEGSFQTYKNSGEYHFDLDPFQYTRVVSAIGYQTLSEDRDLSKITGSQQISENIYLLPLQVAQPPVVEAPRTVEPNNIVYRGRIFDARTNQPVFGKIAFQLPNNANQEAGSFQTTKKVTEFRLNLQPNQYNRIVTANGYETSVEGSDLSNVIGNQQIVQNIYLIPLAVAQPPVVEMPKPVDANKITVRGQIFDARTKQPIIAKIVFNQGNKEAGSFQTSKNAAEFRLELQPNVYNRVVTATGYEMAIEGSDLSNVIGMQQITQNIYLIPLPVVEPPKAAEANNIVVRGQIFDANTRKPIIARIAFQMATNANREAGSFQTSTSNIEYRLDLQPNYYNRVVTAIGFVTNIEAEDLSKITGSQQITQNIYLNPVPVVEPPKVIETAPIQVEENKFRLDKVYFDMSESVILPASYDQLNGLINMLKGSLTMTIQVEGHTDNVGDKDKNYNLSVDRAFAVRQYLIDKGIAGTRVKFKGYGQTKPIASNDTEDGKSKNRRVEFVVLTK